MLFDSIRDLGQACDFAAENLLPDADDKQTILEEFSPTARARKLIDMLEAEKGSYKYKVDGDKLTYNGYTYTRISADELV